MGEWREKRLGRKIGIGSGLEGFWSLGLGTRLSIGTVFNSYWILFNLGLFSIKEIIFRPKNNNQICISRGFIW